jgi:hypothetical protein
MKGAIIVLVVSACVRAQQGSLEGTAIHAVTREPLSHVHVRLVGGSFAGISGAYGAMSDRTGHFSIATIRPGTYVLGPELAGFLYVQAKGGIPNLTIKPGQPLTGYQLEMTPQAVISGRVVDEAGDPVESVGVQTVPATPGSTPIILAPIPNLGTDDRGEFRLVVAPGKYYVQATLSNSRSAQEGPEIRSDGTSEAIYGTTFYPSAVHKERGTVVEAVAGKDAGGIEIRLARQQQGLSISGVVSGFPEGPARGFVSMRSGESAQQMFSGRGTSIGADGKFRFDGLQAGFYRVMAQYDDGKTQLVSRSMEWQLENSEIANVELVLLPPLELSGSVKMEGEAAGAAAPKRTVKLEPKGFFMGNLGMTGGAVDGSGAFRIGNIAPGRYRVKVESLAENAYLKALEIDGVAAAKGIADLSQAARGATAKVTWGAGFGPGAGFRWRAHREQHADGFSGQRSGRYSAYRWRSGACRPGRQVHPQGRGPRQVPAVCGGSISDQRRGWGRRGAGDVQEAVRARRGNRVQGRRPDREGPESDFVGGCECEAEAIGRCLGCGWRRPPWA